MKKLIILIVKFSHLIATLLGNNIQANITQSLLISGILQLNLTECHPSQILSFIDGVKKRRKNLFIQELKFSLILQILLLMKTA